MLFDELNPKQIDWLTSKESLTRRLRDFTQHKITLALLYNDWGMIDHNTNAWIRRMEWRYFDVVWITATVVIPETSINEETHLLLSIGKQSIGDILFQDPTLTRSEFSFSQITENGISRSSTFYYRQQPVLVVENFLPNFFDAVNGSNQ